MPFLTQLDMSAVRHDVQEQLKNVLKIVHGIPVLRNGEVRFVTAVENAAGFAEEPQSGLEPPNE